MGHWNGLSPNTRARALLLLCDDDANSDEEYASGLDDESSHDESSTSPLVLWPQLDTGFPVAFQPLHKTAYLLHRALTGGEMPESSFFHQYVEAALLNMHDRMHHVVPTRPWPPVVLSFAETFRFICKRKGHRLMRGAQDCTPDWSNTNLPFPGETTLSKKDSYTIEPGVMRPLLVAMLQLCRSSSQPLQVPTRNLTLYPATFSVDDFAVTPAHVLAERHREFVGAVPGHCGPQTLTDAVAGMVVDPSKLRQFLATGCSFDVAQALDGVVRLPVGLNWSSSAGATGDNLRQHVYDRLEAMSTCVECLTAHDLNIKHHVLQLPSICVKDSCAACILSVKEYRVAKAAWNTMEPNARCEAMPPHPAACATCTALGHGFAAPGLRACDRCVALVRPCERLTFLALTLDMMAAQRNLTDQHVASLCDGTVPPNHALTQFIPDGTHTVAKNPARAQHNYVIMCESESVETRLTFRALDSDSATRAALRSVGCSAKAVLARDAQSSTDPMAQALAHDVVATSRNVVVTICPDFTRNVKGNTETDIRLVVDVAVRARARYILNTTL